VKIGVISDTHLGGYSPELKNLTDVYFKDVDMIFHAGDMVDIKVLDAFLPRTVEAVSGNMDSWNVTQQFHTKKVLTIEGFRIGLIHGWGTPIGIEDRIRQEFNDVQCIVFGHTHYPVNRYIHGVLFFNPGSPTDKRFVKQNTIGILEIGKKIVGTIVPIKGI
jgi:putative phosphoesterase